MHVKQSVAHHFQNTYTATISDMHMQNTPCLAHLRGLQGKPTARGRTAQRKDARGRGHCHRGTFEAEPPTPSHSERLERQLSKGTVRRRQSPAAPTARTPSAPRSFVSSNKRARS